MVNGSIEIWIFDERNLRRAGFVALVSTWITEAGTIIRQVGSVEALHAELAARAGRSQAAILLASLGATSIAEPRTRATLEEIRAAIGDWPLIIASEAEGQSEVELAVGLGASAFLPSNLSAEVAAAAIRFVLVGGTYFPHPAQSGAAPATLPPARPPQTVRILDQPRMPGLVQSDGPVGARLEIVPAAPNLTLRQAEVLRALQIGLTNKSIARELSLSEATVKVHVRQLMKKFGAMNRTQVALAARP